MRLIIFLILFGLKTGFAQSTIDSATGKIIKDRWTNNFSKGIGLEYSWQNISMANAYFNLKYDLKEFNCLRLCLGAGFFMHQSTFAAPTAVLSYNVGVFNWGVDRKLMINIAAAAWGFQNNGKFDYRVSPEIGLGDVGIINFSYGYNLPVGQIESTFISRNRFVVRLTIP